MKKQLNEIQRMQQLAGINEGVKVKQGKTANDLQFILRDLADAYGEGIADDQITPDFEKYTVGQIKQDWIKLKSSK